LNIDELLEHLTPKDARPTAGALVPPTGQTPQDAELREEYARLHAGGSDHYGQEAWRGAMRRAGRVQ
jgi:hypothetical protein